MKDLPLLNWSLNKTLKSIPDILEQAKIKVFFIIFLLNYPKIGIQLYEYIVSENHALLNRSITSFIVTTLTLKILLSKPQWVNALIHIVQILTAYALFQIVNSYGIDILILQHVFMLIVFSFYGLGRKWGIFYSSINIIFLINHLITDNPGFSIENTRYNNEFLYLFNVFINFFVIAISHYYFHAVLYGTIERKKALTEELKNTAKAKTDFLSTMSHELRTPLNSVIGMTNILLSDNPDKRQIENLNVLKFSAENLLSLINNVLDFNKIDSKNIELEKLPFNLAELLANIGSILKVKAKEKKLDFLINIDGKFKDQNVIGDPTRLSQIIFNIAGNAIKFTEKGSIRVNLSTIKSDNKSITVRFEIKDTGIGISPEKQKLIFEPFKQASKNTSRKYGGTGLGLPIAKHLLELAGSEIKISSELKKGTTFSFDLTFPLTDMPVHPTLTIHTDTEHPKIENLKILLAEDNDMNILFMKKLLSNWNISLTVVENGKEALKAVSEQDFDVILMDIHMPVMDGYVATQKIRSMSDPSKANIYIIALTASSAAEMEKIKERGMNDYLTKPFSIDTLKQKLNNILLSEKQDITE